MIITCPKCRTALTVPDLSLISGGAPFVLPDHPVPPLAGLLNHKAVDIQTPIPGREVSYRTIVMVVRKRCRLSGATVSIPQQP